MFTDYSSFETLTDSSFKYLGDIGRSKQTVEIYNWIWKRIKTYMDGNKISSCSAETVVDYIRITYGDQTISILSHHQKHCFRCALCLAQFAETNKMVEIIQRRESVEFTGEIGEQMTQYIEY